MPRHTLSIIRRCLCLVPLAVLLAGCIEVSVVNNSTDKSAYVMIITPGRTGPIFSMLRPGESHTPLVSEGGPYRVAVLDDKETRTTLEDLDALRETIRRTFTSKSTTAAEAAALQKKFQELTAKFKRAILETRVQCGGRVDDDTSAKVSVSWDSLRDWTISCAEVKVKKDSGSGGSAP